MEGEQRGPHQTAGPFSRPTARSPEELVALSEAGRLLLEGLEHFQRRGADPLVHVLHDGKGSPS